MSSFLPDANCMVAAVSQWHVHHADAIAEIDRRLHDSETMMLAAHAVIEAYSVLTRMPRPYRASPREAHRLIASNFLRHATVLSLDSEAYMRLLDRWARHGIAGGRIYDAVIAACAQSAGVSVLLTFNERHFRQFASINMRIVVPGAGGTPGGR